MADPGIQKRVDIYGGAGHVIGEHNRIYNYFQAPQNRSIASKAIRFLALIDLKTKDFVGRQFVFDALDDFLHRSASGYFVISGEPGIGKTALMAHLIKTRGYPHHFNVSQDNIRTTTQFIESACAQLIARYNLPHQQFPDDVARDSSFLVRLLEEAAQVPEHRPVVLLVDALDESERGVLSVRVNTLYLPWALPQGCYIVVTTRPLDDLRLDVEHRQDLFLEPDSSGNLSDIRRYIENYLTREPSLLEQRLNQWKKTSAEFVEKLTRKCEGNFIYLHHALPAIAEGRFVHGGIDELPQGLQDYYQTHWRQMQSVERGEFDALYAPVVCFLAVARQPEGTTQIARWTGLPEVKVQAALSQWREFLDIELSGPEPLFRVYHTSFRDFLDRQVSLKKYDAMIAQSYLKNLNLK